MAKKFFFDFFLYFCISIWRRKSS